jgi:hypothetical protein
METAKVDIRKLQALNDRINQCIDALNQVRLSVHGLSHSVPGLPYGQVGSNPLSQGYPGFSHSTGLPFGQQGLNPWGQPFLPGFSPSQGLIGANPAFLGGAAPSFNPFQGLSHSSPEEAFARQGWGDPLLALRIAQTFPYAQYPVPVVPLY